MKIHFFAVIAASLLLLSGCASLPSASAMQEDIKGYQLPMLPENGKAIIYVVRPSMLSGRVRFNVYVDDKQPGSEMGYTRNSQYIYFTLAPGDYQILSKAEGWSDISVTAKSGDIIFIKQEPSIGYTKARIFTIHAYEGKYHVKHLSLGTIIKVDK